MIVSDFMTEMKTDALPDFMSAVYRRQLSERSKVGLLHRKYDDTLNLLNESFLINLSIP